MFRYVALVWNDAEPAAREAALRLTERRQFESLAWQVAVKHDGMTVFFSGARPGSSEAYVLPDGGGVVLGKLFVRSSDGHSSSAVQVIGTRESATIVQTGGRHLIETYWGRYVAFLRDADTGATWVLRDPTATLPCHLVDYHGVCVYFSWMEEGVALDLADFQINWKYVAASLSYMRLQLPSTALVGVSQVLGGECVHSQAGRSTRSFYWDPLQIANSEVFDDPALAAAALRRAARDCVQAWAACYDRIVHTLSGGLDSSIVMACLQDAPSQPQIICVNYHSADADGDERAFARLAAQRAGQQLLERERNPNVSFEPLLHMPPTPAIPRRASLKHRAAGPRRRVP